jgi:hypothetical protein
LKVREKFLDDLEWDVKSYLTLGGAMHDAAVSAWGIKGYYDYIRPISAIRYMADKGQSTYPDSVNYHPEGIALIDGYIELVTIEDTAHGFFLADTNKIKLYAWRGPDYIEDPETDAAGVGWILAETGGLIRGLRLLRPILQVMYPGILPIPGLLLKF